MSELNWNLINSVLDSKGQTLEESMVGSKPVLLIFLRHFGCTYCRKTVSEYSKKLSSGEMKNLKVIFIHMSDKNRGDQYFESYGLSDVTHISDPKKVLYKAFKVRRGTFMETLGPQVIVGGVGDLFKYGVGKLEGDGFQMHGAVLIKDRKILQEFKPDHVGDAVDLEAFTV